MGLVACDRDDAIAIDERYPDEMAQRHALIARWGPEVIAAEPGAEPACAELLERLADLLPRRFPGLFAREAGTLRNHLTGERWPLDGAALPIVARLVQEDVCLLELRDGVPVLVAGVLCFTPGWRLRDKLGLPLAAVHGPVPLYTDRLARPVDRFMAKLADGKLVERLNWGLYDNPALFRPGGHNRVAPNSAITPQNAGETIFLRVERQTLSRLERTGTVLFTIRTHVYPLHRVTSVPGAAARLAEAVRAMPPEMHRYKSFAPFAAPLLAHLDAVRPVAATAPAGSR